MAARKQFLKRIITTAVACGAIAFASGAAHAQSMGMDMDSISQFMKYLPPLIKNVTQEPETPKQGDAVKITANVDRIHFADDIETVDSVKLSYTYDGEKWETIDMEQGDDKVNWTCEIPAPGDCTEVDYRITAVDSAGNIAMELPQWIATAGWDGNADNPPYQYLTKIYDHVNSERSEIPDEMQIGEIPPYLDIQTVWFGFDDKNYYFKIQFGEKMQQGTISPVDANLYILAIINCSLETIDNAATDLGLKQGFKNFDPSNPMVQELVKYFWGWYYAPLLDIVPPLPGIGKIPGVGLIHIDPANIKTPIFEKTGFKHKLNGNNLELSVSRSFVGNAQDDTMTFLAGDVKAEGADMTSIKPKIGDISYTTTIIMRDHAYDSCGRPLE